MVAVLVTALSFTSGVGLGLKQAGVTVAELQTCSQDKFVQAVGQAEAYLAMYPEKTLRDSLASAQIGDLERKRYSDALDYAKEHGEGSGTKAFAECLNK